MDSGSEGWFCAPGGTGETDKNKRILSFCRLTDHWGGVLGNRIVSHWDKRHSRGGHKSKWWQRGAWAVREGFLEGVTSELYFEKLRRILVGGSRDRLAFQVEGTAYMKAGRWERVCELGL